MSMGRKMRRAQARGVAKAPEFVKAVNSLSGLKPAINDTQTAVVQALEELDSIEYELRRQRAVFMRMVMEVKGAYQKRSFLVTNDMASKPSHDDPVQYVMGMEEQFRGEYDALFAIARGLMLRQQAEARDTAEIK